MKRRLTAWLTLFALVASVVMPAHAGRHASQGLPGSDFCTAAKSGHAAPAVPIQTRGVACDACCGCAAGAAPAQVLSPFVTHDSVGEAVACGEQTQAPLIELRAPLARAPPAA